MSRNASAIRFAFAYSIASDGRVKPVIVAFGITSSTTDNSPARIIFLSFHTDYPALSNSPDDPFGIMEIALTGVYHAQGGPPWWTDELITREQALTALTIGCAKQMFLENERGSIKTGKYADFLLVTKDVLTCPVKEIHTAKPAATYFEGKKVYSA